MCVGTIEGTGANGKDLDREVINQKLDSPIRCVQRIGESSPADTRLTPRELEGLICAFNEVLIPLGEVRVYLFGSREHLLAKCGDIDLLIECAEQPAHSLTKLTRMLWSAIENNLGEERKIDIVWDTPDQHNAFAQLAHHQGILLWPMQNS